MPRLLVSPQIETQENLQHIQRHFCDRFKRVVKSDTAYLEWKATFAAATRTEPETGSVTIVLALYFQEKIAVFWGQFPFAFQTGMKMSVAVAKCKKMRILHLIVKESIKLLHTSNCV